jgi:hypothetical protein
MSTINSEPPAHNPLLLNEQPPIGARTGQILTDLKALLTKDNIDQLLRHPNAASSTKALKKLGDLLTREKITALLCAPEAKAYARTLVEMGMQLKEDSINPRLKAVTVDLIKSARQENEKRHFDLICMIATIDPDNDTALWSAISDWQQSMSKLHHRARGCERTAKTFIDIGSRLSKSKIDAWPGAS